MTDTDSGSDVAIEPDVLVPDTRGARDRPLALITGAAGDIGHAVALRLCHTHRLALVDHPSRKDLLEERAVILGSAVVHTDTFDVTDLDAVGRAVQACVDSVGAPLALVNNAGLQGAFSPVQRYPLADAAHVIQVNVLGAFHVLALVSAAMAAAGQGGAIVNTSSMAGVSGAANMPAYSASKAAILGLTKATAKDLAPEAIRVNAVSPAFIGPGEMWDRQVRLQAEAGSPYFPADAHQVAAMMIDSVPLRRYGALHEVADVIGYLLSDQSSYVTGVNIEVSGGAV